MTRSEWHDALVHASGPLAVDALADLRPEPELLEAIRDAIQLPWPESGPVEEIEAPVTATLLIGLLGDTESIPLLMDALPEAVALGWDWLIEALEASLSTFGMPAVERVCAEIERIEQESGHNPEPSPYEHSLIHTLSLLASADEAARQIFIDAAVRRIADRTHDPEYRAEPVELATFQERIEFLGRGSDRAEHWVDMSLDASAPELDDAIEEFFTRRGPGFRSPFFGDRQEFWRLRNEPLDRARGLTELYQDYHTNLSKSQVMGASPVQEQNRRASAPALPMPPIEEWNRPASQVTIIRDAPKIGRNDPCPCGSGKKYKKCCG